VDGLPRLDAGEEGLELHVLEVLGVDLLLVDQPLHLALQVLSMILEKKKKRERKETQQRSARAAQTIASKTQKLCTSSD
jgi:hypothetical protein